MYRWSLGAYPLKIERKIRPNRLWSSSIRCPPHPLCERAPELYDCYPHPSDGPSEYSVYVKMKPVATNSDTYCEMRPRQPSLVPPPAPPSAYRYHARETTRPLVSGPSHAPPEIKKSERVKPEARRDSTEVTKERNLICKEDIPVSSAQHGGKQEYSHEQGAGPPPEMLGQKERRKGKTYLSIYRTLSGW